MGSHYNSEDNHTIKISTIELLTVMNGSNSVIKGIAIITARPPVFISFFFSYDHTLYPTSSAATASTAISPRIQAA